MSYCLIEEAFPIKKPPADHSKPEQFKDTDIPVSRIHSMNGYANQFGEQIIDPDLKDSKPLMPYVDYRAQAQDFAHTCESYLGCSALPSYAPINEDESLGFRPMQTQMDLGSLGSLELEQNSYIDHSNTSPLQQVQQLNKPSRNLNSELPTNKLAKRNDQRSHQDRIENVEQFTSAVQSQQSLQSQQSQQSLQSLQSLQSIDGLYDDELSDYFESKGLTGWKDAYETSPEKPEKPVAAKPAKPIAISIPSHSNKKPIKKTEDDSIWMNDRILNLILYIFTGILFILLLEQFIQLGINLCKYKK